MGRLWFFIYSGILGGECRRLSVLIILVLALFHPGDGIFTIPEGF